MDEMSVWLDDGTNLGEAAWGAAGGVNGVKNRSGQREGPGGGKPDKMKLPLNPSIRPVIQPDGHFIHPVVRLFKNRSMPIREVRHKSVKPVRKGEAMIIGKTGFMGKRESTLQLS
jgi:hypothetical protein